jgi:hypothetical protein
LVVLLTIASCELDVESMIFRHFQRFIKKYNKKYSSMNEYLARYNAFRQNLFTLTENGPQSYETGTTKFSDLTPQEFAKTYLNLNWNGNAYINTQPIRVQISNEAPEAFVWRDK